MALWWPVPAGRWRLQPGEGGQRFPQCLQQRVRYGARQVWWRQAESQLQSKQVRWCKQGVSQIKNQPSCGRAEPRGQRSAAIGTRLAYAESGTAGGTAADTEACGLWHVSYPVTKLRWTKREASAGCSGLHEQPPARSPQGWREHGRALPAPWVGGLGAALCSGSGAQGQDMCPRSTKAIKSKKKFY